MRKLLLDDRADVKMIGGVVGILVTLIIAVLVFYNIAGSVDTTTADENIVDNMGDLYGENFTGAANATDDTLAQAATFFTIAPIIAIVVVAVIILKYVGQI